MAGNAQRIAIPNKKMTTTGLDAANICLKNNPSSTPFRANVVIAARTQHVVRFELGGQSLKYLPCGMTTIATFSCKTRGSC
jgi:hypothetical protein